MCRRRKLLGSLLQNVEGSCVETATLQEQEEPEAPAHGKDVSEVR